jgi:hypothetical protein
MWFGTRRAPATENSSILPRGVRGKEEFYRAHNFSFLFWEFLKEKTSTRVRVSFSQDQNSPTPCPSGDWGTLITLYFPGRNQERFSRVFEKFKSLYFSTLLQSVIK